MHIVVVKVIIRMLLTTHHAYTSHAHIIWYTTSTPIHHVHLSAHDPLDTKYSGTHLLVIGYISLAPCLSLKTRHCAYVCYHNAQRYDLIHIINLHHLHERKDCEPCNLTKTATLILMGYLGWYEFNMLASTDPSIYRVRLGIWQLNSPSTSNRYINAHTNLEYCLIKANVGLV